MSHANVYRYFPSRDALLDGLVGRWMAEGEARARQAAGCGRSAAETLATIIIELHAAKRARLSAGPGVRDIYMQAMTKKAEAVAQHRAFLLRTLEEVLRAGCHSGEFAIAPRQIPAVLRVLEAAVTKFVHPLLVAETLDQDTLAEAEALMRVFTEALMTTPQAFAADSP